MLVKAIASFITSDGAINHGDQFELNDTLVPEYVEASLVVPVTVKKKDTAQAVPTKETATAPQA